MKQSVKISEDTSGRIIVDFSYNPVYIEKVKAIKGYKWHPKEKHWSFPYSDGVIGRILSIFKGEKTKLVPTLQVTKKSLKTELNFEDLRRELTLAALEMLREYWKKFEPSSKWLFPGDRSNQHLHSRSVQKIYTNACKKAGITKEVSVLSLSTALLRIYWKAESISDVSRKFWVTKAVKQPRFIPMSQLRTFQISEILWITS